MFFTVEAVLFVAALCLDTFVACFAFGTEGIRIPFLSSAVIAGVCTGVLSLSLVAGTALGAALPASFSLAASFTILALLGILRLIDSAIKNLIRRSQLGRAKIQFRFLSFDFILRIYADNTEADCDHSKVLTPREAAALSLALSVDGLAAGVGAGLSSLNLLPVAVLSLFIGAGLVALGSAIGRRVAARTQLDLSWISGVVLLGLAVMRLL